MNGLSTKILLENGSQQFQSKEKKLSVLYFDKYLLDINKNDNQSMLNRWKSPSERSLYELRNLILIQEMILIIFKLSEQK